MRALRFSTMILSAILLFSVTVMAADGPYDNYLKASDIEKAAGLKGVKLVAKGALSGAGGDLNFATADNKLIVMIQVVGSSQYVGYKKYFFKADIKGVGDQAMEGATIAGLPSNVVAFTKGAECVALTTFGNPAGDGKKNMLTVSQMTALAKTIASRMK